MAGERGVAQLDLFEQGTWPIAVDVPERVEPVAPVAPVPASAARAVPPVLVAAPPPAVIRAIEDAGDELIYNRRNRVRGALNWEDISHLNDALKVHKATKSNIWPKPDYKALIAGGMQPIVAHVFKQVYDSVSVKPQTGRAPLNDEALQRYIRGVKRVERGLLEWTGDAVALKQWADENALDAAGRLGRKYLLHSLGGRSNRLEDMVFPNGMRAAQDELSIVGGNKVYAALQPGYDEIKRAIKAIDKGWPESRETWQIQGYSVAQDPEKKVTTYTEGETFILSVNRAYVTSYLTRDEADTAAAAIKPFALFKKTRYVESFDSEEEAIEKARERTRREKTSIGEIGIKVEAVERVGRDRRMPGQDVSSEDLLLEFGLRGVNFGNWMKTPSARAEAQLHLNHSYDSLHDLADILNIPPKAIGLNGMLGLAIGAQGSGGDFAAHFVPGVNEVNLTRTTGAGSLAHEYAHALDHYFATQGAIAMSAAPFMTEHAGLGPTKSIYAVVDGRQTSTRVPRFGELRPEIAERFKAIVEAMNKRPQTAEEARDCAAAYGSKIEKNIRAWLKDIRRDFVGLEEPFDLLAVKVQAGDIGDGKIALGRTSYISPVVSEIRDLYKSRHGRVYSKENLKSLQSWVDSAAYQASKVHESGEPTSVSTDFARNAGQLDAEKGGKPYWGTNLEKFARAFDAFLSDELQSRAAQNDYLSHTGRVGATVPMGAERVAINGAFKALLGEVRVRETDAGMALFSVQGVTVPTALPESEMMGEIARLKEQWPAMPKVTVVRATADLPFVAPSHADGAYKDGQVYVVAENIADIKQLQKVMAHECILHHGLEQVLGNYGFSKLHSGIQRLKASGDPTVCAIADDICKRYGVLPPDMETKEIVAAAGEKCLDDAGNLRIGFGFMKAVFAGVVNWLRDHGLHLPFTNTELQGLMHSAGAWIQRDQLGMARAAPGEVAGLASLAKDDVVDIQGKAGSMLANPRFADWFDGSGVVDYMTGEPLVVYHGTGATFNAFEYKGPDSAAHYDLDVGPVFYFSDDPETASWYANDCAEQGRGDAVVMPVYLSIKNALVVNFHGEGIEYLAEEIEKAKAAGHDGLIARNYCDGTVSDHFVAFDPGQIKAAIGNRGDYDRGNPDVAFSLAHGAEVPDIVSEGTHHGMVMKIADGVVTQRINRDGETVQHALPRLLDTVAVGDVVEISYKAGCADIVRASLGRHRDR